MKVQWQVKNPMTVGNVPRRSDAFTTSSDNMRRAQSAKYWYTQDGYSTLLAAQNSMVSQTQYGLLVLL